MPFDYTGNVIVVCIFATAFFTIIELIRHRDFQVINSVLIFLAFYAAAVGYDLIAAALNGSIESLPSSWREHLGIAGVVSIGLSLQYLVTLVKRIFAIRVDADEI